MPIYKDIDASCMYPHLSNASPLSVIRNEKLQILWVDLLSGACGWSRDVSRLHAHLYTPFVNMHFLLCIPYTKFFYDH